MSDTEGMMEHLMNHFADEVNRMRMTNCSLVYLLHKHHGKEVVNINLDEDMKDLLGKFIMFNRTGKNSFTVQIVDEPPPPVIINTKGAETPV